MHRRCVQWLSLAVCMLEISSGAASQYDPRGRQFIGFDSLKGFKQENPGSERLILTSPTLSSAIDFNEVIVSWDAELSTDIYLTVEARALYPETTTRFYNLGLWSQDQARHASQSQAGQEDAQGDVSTDTLILRHPARRLQIRLTFTGPRSSAKPPLKFLGISLADTMIMVPPLAPNRDVWGKLIAVPERSQMVYPNGKVLCSPTTVSMLMSHWAQTLNRPELDCPVPQIAQAIYDAQWQGTGNWPFNTAYAGSFPGMRAYVARLSDVAELEAWIAKGIPVGLSLDYDRLRAKGPGPNGHLVVLDGFTEKGDPIINDPGTSEHVRKIFPRTNLIEAWACSRNTVYLIYPEALTPPEDLLGHWDSPRTRNP